MSHGLTNREQDSRLRSGKRRKPAPIRGFHVHRRLRAPPSTPVIPDNSPNSPSRHRAAPPRETKSRRDSNLPPRRRRGRGARGRPSRAGAPVARVRRPPAGAGSSRGWPRSADSRSPSTACTSTARFPCCGPRHDTSAPHTAPTPIRTASLRIAHSVPSPPSRATGAGLPLASPQRPTDSSVARSSSGTTAAGNARSAATALAGPRRRTPARCSAAAASPSGKRRARTANPVRSQRRHLTARNAPPRKSRLPTQPPRRRRR